jgi:hypothetical protein
MKLPNGEQALIDPRKLVEYSLSLDHDDGQHKARLFQTLLGITADNAPLLIAALQRAAASAEAVVGTQDNYGQRYVIDFQFAGPAGAATIGSAWIVRAGEEVPRLVTCYIL